MSDPNQPPAQTEQQDELTKEMTSAHYRSMVSKPVGNFVFHAVGCFDPNESGEMQHPFGD